MPHADNQRLPWVDVIKVAAIGAVVGCALAIPYGNRLPDWVSLSRATLGIYLFHLFITQPAWGFAMTQEPAMRVALLWGIGMVGSLALGLLARRLLGGNAARRWFGF